MKKRGEFSPVASLVLLVVFALLILFFLGKSTYEVLARSADSSCAQSIIKSGLDKVPNFDCKAEKITISRASLEGKAGGKLDEEGLDLAVKRAIADEMYACWKMTGKGLVDPYKESAEIQLGFNRDFFLICKIITLKDVPDFEGLLFWMTLNKPKGEDQTYFDLVYNQKPAAEEILEFEKKQDRYGQDKTYCIAWRVSDPYYYSTSEDTIEIPPQSIIFVPYSELIQTSYKPYYGNGFSTELITVKMSSTYYPALMN